MATTLKGAREAKAWAAAATDSALLSAYLHFRWEQRRLSLSGMIRMSRITDKLHAELTRRRIPIPA